MVWCCFGFKNNIIKFVCYICDKFDLEALVFYIAFKTMKQVTINVPENKFAFFMKLMKSLSFVKVIEPAKTAEEQLTSEQREIWNNVKQGFIELKLAEEGKIKFRPVEELLDEL